MSFENTSQEARIVAKVVAEYYRKRQYNIRHESAFHADAPLRTTLMCQRRHHVVLVEVQHRPQISGVVKQLAHWLAMKNAHCELYIAIPQDVEFSGQLLASCTRECIGLITVHDGRPQFEKPATNFGLRVGLHPEYKFGQYAASVKDVFAKFNAGQRKDAIREISEMVEKLTDAIVIQLASKGAITHTHEKIANMSFSNQVGVLATMSPGGSAHVRRLDPNLVRDLSSFVDARNLFDHKVRSANEERRRDLQSVEKLHQGARLLDELIRYKRRIR